MRKKQIICLICLIVSAQLSGQVPPWDWVNAIHTNMEEVATDVVADPATGHVYLAGYWRGPLDSFIPGGGIPSTDFSDTYGRNDGLVAKYDPSGNLLWAFKIGGENHDYIHAIHLDMDGNIYITGTCSEGNIQFSGTASLTPDSAYINTVGDDFILAKYDPQGRLLWMRHSEGSSWTEGRGITSNTSGVYVTGSQVGDVSFGPLPAHDAGAFRDLFVVKYSTDGDVLWNIWGSSNRADYGEDIICDETHIYVTGEFEGSMLSLTNAAGDIMPVVMNTADGLADIFLASFTEDGNHQWTHTIVGPEDDYCLGITMDSDSLYLAGSIGAPALFPSFTGNPVNHKNGQDAFICAMSRLDGSTGWVLTLADESGGDEMARDISMDIDGNLYLTGYFDVNIETFYGIFDTKGAEDIFMASFTDDGKYRWIKTAGSSTSDFGNGVSAAAPGHVYLSGDYSGMTEFDSIIVPNDVNTNIYLARLQLPCLDAVGGVLSTTNTVICAGDTVYLWLKNYYGEIEWQTSPPGMNSWSSLTADLSDSISITPVVTADYRAFLRSDTCNSDSSNVIAIQLSPVPTADISGSIFKCDDGTTSLFQVDLSGSPPWELAILHNGVSDTTISGIGVSPYLLEVSREGTYTLGNVSDINCTGTVSGTASLIYLASPSPDPGIGGDTCGLVFDLQAFPVFNSGLWSQVSGPGTTLFSPSSDSATVTVTATDYGNYEFKWTETNGTCIGDSSVVVHFFQQPIITIIPGAKTCGLQHGLNVNSNTNSPGSWSLSNGPGSATFLPDEQTPDAMVEVDAYGLYNFQWTATNGVCSATAVTDVEFLPPPFVDAGEDQSVCLGETNQLSATGQGTFLWSFSAQLSDISIPDPMATIDVNTTFHVLITDSEGCQNSDSLTLFVYPPPIADAGPDQHHIARFETSLEGQLGPDDRGTWSVVSGGGIFQDPNRPETRVTSLETGENIFAWNVSNEVCPEVSDQVSIWIGDFVIPTVITPNGDGKNDRFHVEGILEFPASELRILNQWGEEVYHSAPYLNDWDGRDHNGRELPEDTYFSVLKIKSDDVRKAYVLIIR